VKLESLVVEAGTDRPVMDTNDRLALNQKSVSVYISVMYCVVLALEMIYSSLYLCVGILHSV
jgi:hypothetical protein